MNIDRLLQHQQGSASIPPVDEWQPALSGDIDILIQADGVWLHQGQPFGRPAIPRLLASLLRHDDDGYCLVTPVERWRLSVEDRPFIAVEADFHSDAWWFTTQFDDVVRLDEQHPMALTAIAGGERMPEVAVRFGLGARLHRNVYYRLVEQAIPHDIEGGGSQLRLYSAGSWHLLGELSAGDGASVDDDLSAGDAGNTDAIVSSEGIADGMDSEAP
ncbi:MULTISPECIES: DUF1285 domain-containing protein [unclassified Halomonas]|uniref:DUF1285 domain-containing protein n=1 Tax=unclassified Halomonas TaxID=2609666 RepID=UPI00099071A0|nr:MULTISPECIES: DUF1285 domain-containing protein [unclassified Halomonas]AVU09251.1 hypothetical protein BV504_05520 [Halomonas sp. 'Soap Lake \